MDQNTVPDSTTDIDRAGGKSGDAASELRGSARQVWLAGLGAVASACDVAGDQFDQFVRRGERVREELQGRADEMRRENAGTRLRLRDYFRQTMDAFWDGVHVPNKTDVDTINIKLNILTRKIDDLQMRSMGAAGPGTPASSPPGPDIEAAAEAPSTAEPGELYPPS